MWHACIVFPIIPGIMHVPFSSAKIRFMPSLVSVAPHLTCNKAFFSVCFFASQIQIIIARSRWSVRFNESLKNKAGKRKEHQHPLIPKTQASKTPLGWEYFPSCARQLLKNIMKPSCRNFLVFFSIDRFGFSSVSRWMSARLFEVVLWNESYVTC